MLIVLGNLRWYHLELTSKRIDEKKRGLSENIENLTISFAYEISAIKYHNQKKYIDFTLEIFADIAKILDIHLTMRIKG